MLEKKYVKREEKRKIFHKERGAEDQDMNHYHIAKLSCIRSSASTTTKKGTEAAPELSSRSLEEREEDLLDQVTIGLLKESMIDFIDPDIEDLIKRGIVPEALNELLSPSTYKDYFAALLYAEDFYIEKWSKFKLENITLKLQDAAISKRYGRKEYFSESHEKDDKTFVEFEIDSCRERRPFLLSRDFA
uniref:Uncharacterized protein n=1 Tax=Salix viminalis TaxID=40686 RepID=A0A6N2M0V1_SALVM